VRSTCEKVDGQILFRTVTYPASGSQGIWVGTKARPSHLVRATGCCYSPSASMKSGSGRCPAAGAVFQYSKLGTP
jgi:hypothetical protein